MKRISTHDPQTRSGESMLDGEKDIGHSTPKFLLDTHPEGLMVEEEDLRGLREHRPKRPTYMIRGDRKRGNRRRSLVKEWDLVVSQEILETSWEEFT